MNLQEFMKSQMASSTRKKKYIDFLTGAGEKGFERE
jgi:hypothetical protein